MVKLEEFLTTLYLRGDTNGGRRDYVKLYRGNSYVTDFCPRKHIVGEELKHWLSEYSLNNCHVAQWQVVAARSCSIICVHCERDRRYRPATFTI